MQGRAFLVCQQLHRSRVTGTEPSLACLPTLAVRLLVKA